MDKVGRVMAEHFLDRCVTNAGPYNSINIRGRGGWFDAGRIVLHCGSSLIVDGKPEGLASFKSRYTYEAGIDYPLVSSASIPNTETVRLLNLCKQIHWDRPVNAALLAGWIALAPFCGALEWRPHISINGESGSGKTWIVENIIRAMLVDISLDAVGDSTEAGLRQELAGDARPIVFDEFEPTSKRAKDRITGILALMRASSSSGAAPITKGTAGGDAMRFFARSMFCFSGISIPATEIADLNRISTLTALAYPDGQEKVDRFAQIEADATALITPQFIAGFRARVAELLPVIRQNARVFANAWTIGKGNRRTGDQTGTILAGAYALISKETIVLADATDYINRQDWTDEVALNAERDPIKLRDEILRHVERVTAGAFQGDLNVGELIEIAEPKDVIRNSEHPSSADADGILQRLGIRVEVMSQGASQGTSQGSCIMVSTKPEVLRKILGNTPWSHGHSKILLRLPGASASRGTVRFQGGFVTKVTVIPLKSFIEPNER